MSLTGSDVIVAADGKNQAAAIARALRRAAREARMPASIVSGGTGFRRSRKDRLFTLGLVASFVAIILLPAAVAGVYYGLVASDQYATETRFSLRSGEPGISDMLGGLTGGGGSQQAQDSAIIIDYARSRSMIESLEQQMDLRQIFSRDGLDYFSRFRKDKPIESLVRYWRKRIDAHYDKMSGIIALEVRAFTPEDSLLLTEKIVDQCEKLVNDLSQRSRRDALQQATLEFQRAEAQLKTATADMRETQNSQGILDVVVEAQAVNKIISQLRMELARAEQQIAGQGDTVSADAPQVRVLNARVQTLQDQISKFSSQIADKKHGGESLADSKRALDLKQTDLGIAMQRYVMASVAFENARLDLETQRSYLAPFVKPMLATRATYPKRWWDWFLVSGPAFLAWALIAGAGFLVRDHMAK
ncbi:MAG: capsular polysaccharide transport system permease protein [Methylobacteriaceae bacterium]|nr:capsular polysaccharide transport system permease protein [Methylobacteriaceae bacterium]